MEKAGTQCPDNADRLSPQCVALRCTPQRKAKRVQVATDPTGHDPWFSERPNPHCREEMDMAGTQCPDNAVRLSITNGTEVNSTDDTKRWLDRGSNWRRRSLALSAKPSFNCREENEIEVAGTHAMRTECRQTLSAVSGSEVDSAEERLKRAGRGPNRRRPLALSVRPVKRRRWRRLAHNVSTMTTDSLRSEWL